MRARAAPELLLKGVATRPPRSGPHTVLIYRRLVSQRSLCRSALQIGFSAGAGFGAADTLPHMTYLPPKACSRSKLGSIDHPSLPAKKTAMVSFVARQLHCGPYCSSRLNMAFFATTFSSTATGAAKAFRSLRMRNVQLTPAPGLSRCRSVLRTEPCMHVPASSL